MLLNFHTIATLLSYLSIDDGVIFNDNNDSTSIGQIVKVHGMIKYLCAYFLECPVMS
jgi:hypothetical protein